MEHRLKTTVAGVLIVMGLAACGGGGGGVVPSTAAPAEQTGATPGGSDGSGGSAGATPNSTGDNTGSGSPGAGSTGSAATTGATTAGPATIPDASPPATGSSSSNGSATGGSTSPGTPGGGISSVPPPASAFAQVTVATNVVPAATAPTNQMGPVASRLANGGSVIVWLSGSSLMAQQLDGAGNKAGPLQTVSALPDGPWSFSVAGLASGDWVVAWSAQTITPVVTPRAMPYTIQTKRYNASGAVVQDTTQIPGTSFQAVDPRLQLKATADGGYVLAWSHSEGSPFLFASFQRFGADGSPSGARVFTGNSAGGGQTRVQAVPLADGSVVIAWLQNTPGTGSAAGSTYSVHWRRFDSANSPIGNESEVAATMANAGFPFAVSSLSNGNLALAWAQPPGSQQVSAEARWQVLGLDGSPVTAMAGRAVAPLVDGVGIAPAGTGFTVFAQASSSTARGSIAHIDTLAIDASGALASNATIADRVIWSAAPSSGAGLGPASFDFAVAAGNDGHLVVAFETAKQDALAEVDALGQ